MGKVTPIRIRRDVGETEDIQLLLTTTTGSIDGEQDGPGDTAADEHDGRRQLEESQQEVRIHRVMLENVGIRELVHRTDPAKQASGGFRGALPWLEVANVGSGHVLATLALSQNDKDDDHHGKDDDVNDQGGQETRQGIRGLAGVILGQISQSHRDLKDGQYVRHG